MDDKKLIFFETNYIKQMAEKADRVIRKTKKSLEKYIMDYAQQHIVGQVLFIGDDTYFEILEVTHCDFSKLIYNFDMKVALGTIGVMRQLWDPDLNFGRYNLRHYNDIEVTIKINKKSIKICDYDVVTNTKKYKEFKKAFDYDMSIVDKDGDRLCQGNFVDYMHDGELTFGILESYDPLTGLVAITNDQYYLNNARDEDITHVAYINEVKRSIH